MSDSLWIIGVAMTKFMRYKDKDLIDLGSEAAHGGAGRCRADHLRLRHPGGGLPV